MHQPTGANRPVKDGVLYFTLEKYDSRLIFKGLHLQHIGGIFAWWFDPRREAGRLGRDAVSIIEAARAVSSSGRMRDVALRIKDELGTAHERGGGDPSRYAPLIDHFKTRHREARRQRDDGTLTALTLIIIYLRAEQLGADAAPARDHIDTFISEWTQV